MGKAIIFSKEQEEEMVNLYLNEKLSLQKIADKFGVSRHTIKRVIQEHNGKIRTTKETSRKYTNDDNFFEKIDTEEKAYWLGFIAADGYITTKRAQCNQQLGITLSEKDINHLEKFKKSLKATNPINIYEAWSSCYNKNSKFARVLITSQKLVDDIKKFGIVE